MPDAPEKDPFSSKKYWDDRYRNGGNSGAGSYGVLARFKADFINSFVEQNGIDSVVDFGFGDGAQLELLTSINNYVGVDVSPVAIERARKKFPAPRYRFVDYDELAGVAMAPLAMSIDVIYHLIEDAVYEKYLRDLFCFSTNFVLVYSSDYAGPWSAQHVRHRPVSSDVKARFPEWRLVARVLNPRPYSAQDPTNTSFCDFLIFARENQSVNFSVPRS